MLKAATSSAGDRQTLHLCGHMANDVARHLERMRPGLLRKTPRAPENGPKWIGDRNAKRSTTGREAKVLLFPTWQEVRQKCLDGASTGDDAKVTLWSYIRAYQGKRSGSKDTLYVLRRQDIHDLLSEVQKLLELENPWTWIRAPQDNVAALQRDILASLSFHKGVDHVYVEPRGQYDLVLSGSDHQSAARKIHSLIAGPVAVRGGTCFGPGCTGMGGSNVDLNVFEEPVVDHGPRVGFWMTACAEIDATAKVIERTRLFYPDEYIFLVSDCGFDYSELAKKHNVTLITPDQSSPEVNAQRKQKAALRAAYGMGTNQYGMDVASWLGWWFKAAEESGCDWLIHLEDDVWTSHRHDPVKLPPSNVGIAGPSFRNNMRYPDQLYNWLNANAADTVKRPIQPYYNGMGASIVSTEALRRLESRLSDIDISTLHEYDRRFMRGTDITMCLLMLMVGYDVDVWTDCVDLREVPNYHQGEDVEGIAFQHGRKDFYNTELAGAHAALLPWQVFEHPSHASAQAKRKTLIILNARSDISLWEIGMRMKGFFDQEVYFFECRKAISGQFHALDFTALQKQEADFRQYLQNWENGPASGPTASTTVLAVSDWWSTVAQVLGDRLRQWPADRLAEVTVRYVHLYIPLQNVVTSEDNQLAVLHRLIEFCMMTGRARDDTNFVEAVTLADLEKAVDRLGDMSTVRDTTLGMMKRMLGYAGEGDAMLLSPKIEHDLVVNLADKTSMLDIAEEIAKNAQQSTISTKIIDFMQTVRGAGVPWHHDCEAMDNDSAAGRYTPEVCQGCFNFMSTYWAMKGLLEHDDEVLEMARKSSREAWGLAV
mmetsp:Transcript_104436/g.179965  ORF Transcript_104436/g.179965 Transcript_104436/m.179965 type:complete len:825 (-) Transcript_104436:127-2601(-)